MFARGNDLEFDHAVIEMIVTLLAEQSHHAALVGFLACRGNIPGREVARTDVDDLALLHQCVEALPGFVPRAVAIDVMHLVEVDPVRLQPAQAALAVLANLVGAQAGTVAVHFRQVGLAINRVVNLGCQDDRIAAPAALRQPASDDLFGEPAFHGPAVDIGCVKEIDAELQCPVHDLETVLFRRVPAEVHRAETDVADQDAVIPQPPMLHCHALILESSDVVAAGCALSLSITRKLQASP